MINDKAPWTAEQIEKLAELYFSVPKPSIDHMSAVIGRSPHATWNQIARIGMSKRGAQVRKCLPCDHNFYSTHVGNRMCQRCLESDELRCA